MNKRLLTCQAATNDIAQSGNYEIVHCGSQIHKIQRLLDYTRTTLSQFIQDLDHPTVPQEKALHSFMNGVPVSEIKAMFQHIVDGTKLPLGARPDGKPRPPGLYGPMIICIDPQNETLKPLEQNCQKDPNVAAFKVAYMPYIVLCPRFSTLRLRFGFQACPILDGQDPQRRTNMHNSQFAIFVHELIHFYYAYNQTRNPEVYSPNQMINLPPGEAQWNPSNWGWLVSSESLRISTFGENPTMGTTGRG